MTVRTHDIALSDLI